jgi:hypothetical protein
MKGIFSKLRIVHVLYFCVQSAERNVLPCIVLSMYVFYFIAQSQFLDRCSEIISLRLCAHMWNCIMLFD